MTKAERTFLQKTSHMSVYTEIFFLMRTLCNSGLGFARGNPSNTPGECRIAGRSVSFWNTLNDQMFFRGHKHIVKSASTKAKNHLKSYYKY